MGEKHQVGPRWGPRGGIAEGFGHFLVVSVKVLFSTPGTPTSLASADEPGLAECSASSVRTSNSARCDMYHVAYVLYMYPTYTIYMQYLVRRAAFLRYRGGTFPSGGLKPSQVADSPNANKTATIKAWPSRNCKHCFCLSFCIDSQRHNTLAIHQAGNSSNLASIFNELNMHLLVLFAARHGYIQYWTCIEEIRR